MALHCDLWEGRLYKLHFPSNPKSKFLMSGRVCLGAKDEEFYFRHVEFEVKMWLVNSY